MRANKRPERLAITPGDPAAIYCRISSVRDDDQTGVDRQERICRDIANKLNLTVNPDHVFVDNSRSAWSRKRKRPGWDKLLEGATNQEFRHIIAYHPDRLMRQPRDLEELLQISDNYRIMLHGEANRRDLTDPDDRFILRIEVAHACRSSDDTSRRILDAMKDRSANGAPHGGGRRAYGYLSDGLTIIEDEAAIVREVFTRYVSGWNPIALAKDLNARHIPTSRGKAWTAGTIRMLLDSHHVAGLRIHQGVVTGDGSWPAIIDRGLWDEARTRREFRSAVHQDNLTARRFYLLRGIVYCERCGTQMTGSKLGGVPQYCCTRRSRAKIDEKRCVRKIAAVKLESFVVDAAIDLLERLKIGSQLPVSALRADVAAQIEQDKQQLAELNKMWSSREISTPEYRAMRKDIMERIDKAGQRTVIRPMKVLEGMTGPKSREAWNAEDVSDERRNAVLSFLFAAVRIGASTKPNGVFDWDRITIEQNPLS